MLDFSICIFFPLKIYLWKYLQFEIRSFVIFFKSFELNVFYRKLFLIWFNFFDWDRFGSWWYSNNKLIFNEIKNKKCSLFIFYIFKRFVKTCYELGLRFSLKSHEKLEKWWIWCMVKSNSDNGTERKKVEEMTGFLFIMYKFVQII